MFTKPCCIRSVSFVKFDRSPSAESTVPMSSLENPAQLVAHQVVLLTLASLLVNLIMSETCVKSPSSP